MQFKRRREPVAKMLAKQSGRDANGKEFEGEEYKEVLKGDENGKLDGAKIVQKERAAAARPVVASRIENVMQQICAFKNLCIPNSAPKQMPPQSPRGDGKRFNKLMFHILHYYICMFTHVRPEQFYRALTPSPAESSIYPTRKTT